MTAEDAPVAHRSWWRTALPDVAIPYGITRLALLLIGWLTWRLPLNPGYPIAEALQRGWHFSPHRLVDIWGRWDSGWYLNIATRGYAACESGQCNTAFFPLYPLLVRGVLLFIPNSIETPGIQLAAAALVANALFVGALVLLHRLALVLSGERAMAQRAVWYLCVTPGSFLLSAAYADGTALFFMVGAFLAAERRRWWWAGVFGALAALARPQGFLIALPLAWRYLEQRSWNWRALRADALSLGIPVMGVVAFAAAVYPVTQNWLAPLQSQGAWGRHFALPWETLIRPIQWNPLVTPIEIILLVGALLAALFSFRRWSPAYALTILLLLAPSLFSGMTSGALRYVAVAFPLVLFLAHWGRNRAVDRTILTIFALVQAVLALMWFQFFYVA